MKNRDRTWTIPVLAGLLIMAATSGCTSSTTRGVPSAQPSAPGNSPGSNSDPLPSNGAPRVPNPVNTAKFESAPCSLLSEEQRRQLSIPSAGRRGNEPAGPQCVWEDLNTPYGYAIGATFDRNFSEGRGLSHTYSIRSNFPDFEPLASLNGFPAVIANKNSDDRTNGYCVVDMGLSDQQQLTIDVQIDLKNPNFKNSCAVAEEAARAFADTAKQAGGS